jgi:hypothetical protein
VGEADGLMAISSGLGGYTPPGLVLVKSQTIGSAVSSVTVTNAFSANWENYKIVWNGGYCSAGNEIGLKFGSSTANYFGFLNYAYYTGTTVYGANDNNQSSFRYVGGADPYYCSLNVDVFGPYLARVTTINSAGNFSSSAFGTYSGRHAVETSYTDFTLTPGAGTMTGGVIRVYGYRN